MSSVKEEQLVADLSTTPDRLQENLSRRDFKEAATDPTGGRPFVLNIRKKFLQTSVGWSKSYPILCLKNLEHTSRAFFCQFYANLMPKGTLGNMQF